MTASECTIEIGASAERAFDLLHDYGRRLEWDPFLREAKLLGEASRAGAGVSSLCRARWPSGGLSMETVYVSYRRPEIVAVEMTRGPWFLRTFAASIRHEARGPGRSLVAYRFNFRVRPGWIEPWLAPLFRLVFRRETRRRLERLKHFLESGRDQDSPSRLGGSDPG